MVIQLQVSMPHAALWVVQRGGGQREPSPMEVSMPHAALWVVQRSWERSRLVAQSGFNAARGFVGGATVPICAFGLARCSFNAARGFVGGATPILMAQMKALTCFNAARGFVGGATARRRKSEPVIQVSMPHAALWVVQLSRNSRTFSRA